MRALIKRFLPKNPRLRAWLRSCAKTYLPSLLGTAANPGSAPEDVAPAGPSDLPDYLVWGVIDWHFRLQRPQQLARLIASAGRRVFYISANLINGRKPGFRVEALDDSGRLFQVFFALPGAPAIYFRAPTPTEIALLRDGLTLLSDWCDLRSPISLVDHPFWGSTARLASSGKVVFDRMDYHEGFGTYSESVAAAERDLLRSADLTIATSEWLSADSARYTDRRLVIRNATDYQHFSSPPNEVFRDPRSRRVIGYFGAIAEWMDLELVAELTKVFHDCVVVLVGRDQCDARRRLRRLPNLIFTGEVPYQRLPYYVYGFDVCILPFRIIPLTLATNPVKVYEYLSAGRPVVTVDLPEISQFGDLVYSAADRLSFLRSVRLALAESPDDPLIDRRKRFAASQTWEDRAQRLMTAAEHLAGAC